MTNDNETVKQVCDWLKERDLPFAASIAEVKYANPSYDAEACLINALKNLADRIEAAHKREMLRNKSLLRTAGELSAGLMNKVNAQNEEIKKLRAALMPVLAVCPNSYESHFIIGGCWRVPIYNGKLCEAAVLEAQRIYNESEVK